ncbi:MAG TPA: hydrogenase maturation protease [Terriglobia bacterium]|nr:hydrogenase maturation protease [Terriglobia bacterium]
MDVNPPGKPSTALPSPPASTKTSVSSPHYPITRSSARVLVAGCGNQLAADDGVGVEIVRRLRGRGDCGCEFLELAGGGFDLLYAFEKAEIILIVDAVQSGAAPGTVHLLPLPSGRLEPRSIGKISGHGWGLDKTLRLAHSLGWQPPRLMLLGVELERATTGSACSPAAEAALEEVVARFPELLAALPCDDSPLWKGHHSYPPLTPAFTACAATLQN